jgi:predicted RNA binding protein YcfA (HicA-like mRNA interferase family)
MKFTPYREVKRKLEAAGFAEFSHVKFAKRTPEGLRTTTVPHHREVAPGTIRSILRQAGLTQEEFDTL